MHQRVDRYFAQRLAALLDELDARPAVGGGSRLEAGVSVRYNDHGNGPARGYGSCPFVLGGSAGGFFPQGRCVRPRSGGANCSRMLATPTASAGVVDARGESLAISVIPTWGAACSASSRRAAEPSGREGERRSIALDRERPRERRRRGYSSSCRARVRSRQCREPAARGESASRGKE